ncbi:MAG: diphosphatase [Frankiales bacterium]|nr:diphosphatase [Frankiales bacterium]
MSLPALSRATVDRDAATRDSPELLEKAWQASRVLVVDDQSRALLDGTDLVFLSADAAPEGDRLYLGAESGQPYFAVRAALPRKLGAQPRSLRDVGALLSDRDAGLLVHAVGLANWHATHPRCPRCGAPTTAIRGGSVRLCTEDGSEHFPRTDPAMIVLVTDGADRCVLGRQAIWPVGRYSTLAGFVEPGESAEQAVVREVWEETGIVVTNVAYEASQPWPFPASLMLGFRATCASDAVPVATDGELEDARWFTKDELRDGTAMLPTPVSIAYKLIMEWLQD